MSGSGWRPHIESALCLSLPTMFKRGWLRPGSSTAGMLTWTHNGDPIGSISYSARLHDDTGTLTLDYSQPDRDSGERKAVQCVIRLGSLPLHYGGRRWYMHCPYTHRRALNLYKFSGIEKFCHRTAIRPLPTFASQRVSGSDRIIAQRWLIRRRIGDNLSDLFGEPFKPKWMRQRTFERYAERDAELAEAEDGYLFRMLGRMMR